MLGVTGVCTVGLSPALLSEAIATARAVTPNGQVVLHVGDAALAPALVEEATVAMVAAAADLVGSRDIVENVQTTVYTRIVLLTAADLEAAPAAGGGDGGASASTAPAGSVSSDATADLPAGGHMGVLDAAGADASRVFS